MNPEFPHLIGGSEDPLSPTTVPHLGTGSPGFALIVSLGLLALALLLLVSIASLVKVEQSIAVDQAERSIAENNALLAAQIAVGELQKFAGPDQRVSTTADLVADSDLDGGITPDSIYPETTPRLSVSPGARYWTGIWGNDQATIGYDLRPNEMPSLHGNVRGMAPVLLTWLVSGNEAASYSLDGNRGGVDVAGGAGENSTVVWAPDASINWTGGSEPTVGGQPAAVLVGAGSVRDTSADRRSFVVAPLVEIPATNGGPSGRYAWWVGDEGVKARVNLRRGALESGQAEDQINGFLMAQRSGIEFMSGEQVYSVDSPVGPDTVQIIGDDYDSTDEALERISFVDELSMLSDTTDGRDRLNTAVLENFHAMTANSFGVLADTYAGGLRKDLTADLADTATNFSYRPADDAPIFQPISDSEENLPTWGHLRSWARLHPDAEGKIDARAASDTDAGLAPVLNYFAIGLDIRTYGNTLNVYLTPVAVLYNPYPVTLRGADYEVGIRISRDALMDVRTAPEKPDSADPSDPVPFTTKAFVDLGRNEITATDLGDFSEFIYFTIEGLDLPSGESHIYYLDDSLFGQPYTGGMRLTRAPAGEDANPLNFCLMPGSGVIALSESDDHYLQVLGRPHTSSSDLRWGHTGYSNGIKADIAFSPVGGISGGGSFFQLNRAIRLMEYATHQGNQMIVNLGKENPTDSSGIPPRAVTYEQADHLDKLKAFESGSAGGGFGGRSEYPRATINYSVRMETGPKTQAQGSSPAGKIWLRHGNPRAAIGSLTLSEIETPVRNSALTGGNVVGGLVLSNGDQYYDPNFDVQPKEYALNSAGELNTHGGDPAGLAVLFDVLEDPERLLSLGQLQHAPLSRFTFYNPYPLGNSYAGYRVPRTSTYREDIVPRGDSGGEDPLYDLSYHLNRALWDRYFFSTVPSGYSQADLEAGEPLPNSRMTPFDPLDGGLPELGAIQHASGGADAYDRAAAHLLNAGAFNINSTSEDAWAAVLSGTYGIPQNSDYAAPGDDVGSILPFPRISSSLVRNDNDGRPFPNYIETMATNTAGDLQDFRYAFYYGNRGLYLNDPGEGGRNDAPETLVRELARTLVEQVRRRGPFLSLSDFVNRAMTDTPEAEGIKGALQAAIDGMETSQANPMDYWEGVTTLGALLDERSLAYQSHDVMFPEYDLEQYLGGPLDEILNEPEKTAYRYKFAGGPKFLTQADVLSTLGPSLSARSDTFKVRAYGESTSRVNGESDGRVWCEVVVQRTPGLVDDSVEPEAPMSEIRLNDMNRTFGRAFEVVSFRWLDPQEI